MSSARDLDLERWENGGLSMSELLALHGSDGVAGLVSYHRRMSALGSIPVGDPEKVWRAICERMPDRAHPQRTGSLRRRLTRPLAIAAAAVLIAGTAYAGSPNAVQRYLTSFWQSVQEFLDVDVVGSGPADTGRPSKGQGDPPAGALDDAELEDREGSDANEDGDQPGETSEGDDGDEAKDDDENDSGDDAEGIGDDEGDDSQDDDASDEPEDDEDDEPEENDEPESDESEEDDDEPEGDDEED